MINFTLIIPHKNTPDLLQKCLNSIPRRKDVQIIVVDDNSDEDKVDFNHFPGLDDPTVEVFLTKEGKGAGYARNVGLSHAIGKWLIFADADDFFMPSLSSFLDAHGSSNADVVLWKVCSIDLDTSKPGFRGSAINKFADEALQTGNFDNSLLISHLYKGMYSSKMIFCNNIRFNECRWGNDTMFSSRVAVAVKKAEVFEDIVYCITRHSSFGLISNPTLESRIVRFDQECQSIRIIKKKFSKNKIIHFYFYTTWLDVYKIEKKTGIRFLPKAIMADSFPFIFECLKAKLN